MEPVEPDSGLCATCRYQRTVEGARTTFSLCERAFTDPRFLKYPPIPVVRCVGYVERPSPPAAPPKKR